MKLFKKAMAAVLAGVMALAMVACAPAGNKEETKVPESSATTAEGKFFDMLNGYLEGAQKTNNATQANAQVVFPKFSNELKSDAEAVLNAISAGAVLDQDGKVVKYAISAPTQKALKDIGTVMYGSNYTVVELGHEWTKAEVETAKWFEFSDAATTTYIVGNTVTVGATGKATVKADKLLKKAEEVTAGGKTTTTYEAAYKIGVATKKIGDAECTVIVVKAV